MTYGWVGLKLPNFFVVFRRLQFEFLETLLQRLYFLAVQYYTFICSCQIYLANGVVQTVKAVLFAAVLSKWRLLTVKADSWLLLFDLFLDVNDALRAIALVYLLLREEILLLFYHCCFHMIFHRLTVLALQLGCPVRFPHII